MVWHSLDAALFAIDPHSIIKVNVTDKGGDFKRIYQLSKPNKDTVISYSTELEGFVLGSESESYKVFSLDGDGKKSALFSSSEKVSKLIFIEGTEHYIEQADFSDKRVISLVKNNRKTTLLECRYIKMCSLNHYAKSSNEVYYRGLLHTDKDSLLAVHIETKAKRVIATDAEDRVDIYQQWIHPDDSVTVSYLFDTPKYSSDYQPMQSLLKALGKQLEHNIYKIQISDSNRRAFISAVTSSSHHPLHFSYDFSTQVLTPFEKLVSYPMSPLKSESMVTSTPIHYKASDGMLLHGYLWTPRGVNLTESPIVTLVHGGPWARDFGLFCIQCQLLVNRGYAVFQPNYRASWGFGLNYTLAANQDFGKGRVLKDTIDGIEYLLQNGIGDREKLAITGHSFGGFTTLSALAFEPGYFKGGFASAPPMELTSEVTALFSRNKPRFGIDRANEFNILLADENNPAQHAVLLEKSPQKHYRNIIDPLLMLAGGRDKKVGINRVNQFAAALNAEDKSISYFVDEKMGHSPKTSIQKKAMMHLLESFMATHLNGQVLATQDDALESYLNRHRVYMDIDHFVTQEVRQKTNEGIAK